MRYFLVIVIYIASISCFLYGVEAIERRQINSLSTANTVREQALQEKAKKEELRRQRIIENKKLKQETESIKNLPENVESELRKLVFENELLRQLCKQKKIDITPVSEIINQFESYSRQFANPLSIGQVAFLNKNCTNKVIQIIDKSNLIIEIGLCSPDGYSRIEKQVWVSGVNTDGLVDNSFFESGYPFKISRTTTYTNVLGASTTVFVLEPVGFNLQKLP